MANIKYNQITRVSQLLQSSTFQLPITNEKMEILSKGYTHMISKGIIKPVQKGMHVLLPLGFRVLEKLTKLIDKEMFNIKAQKILLPALTSANLWQTTNRYESAEKELFKVADRYGVKYVLSPTYEEAICNLLSTLEPISQKQLPLRLYQISSKWRDEMKPRLGLLRSREFIMKDLYTFDANLDNAENTYNLVGEAYNNIFDQIGIKYIKAKGSTEFIGGSLSHEYQFLCDVGEDIVLSCSSCNYHANQSIHTTSECPHCNEPLEEHNAIEVGHMFLLDTKYSKPLDALYTCEQTKEPLAMGCYGIGLTRIMAAAVEILSDDTNLKWPANLAPYTVIIIPPKKGSKEEAMLPDLGKLYETLYRLGLDAVLDDRTQWTIGKRLKYAKATGYPYAIVLGKALSNSMYEICDLYNDSKQDLILEDFGSYFANNNNTNSENVLLQESRL